MRTLSAKKLSLEKARNLGIYEEPVTIGDCELVLRNLRPDEYESALADCSELEDLAYLNAFQKAHVSRAICQVNGQDLREVEYIEDEEPDPKTGKMKTVRVERHEYLRKHLVDSWSKEVIFVAYRKLGDVVAEAEKKAKDGIQFRIAEESPEEKYRRLLGDVKEIEQELPEELTERILEEAGYLLRRSVDVSRLDAAAGGAAAQQSQGDAADAQPAVEEAPAVAPSVASAPVAAPQAAHGRTPAGTIPVATVDPVKLMRERVPLHTQAAQAGTPVPPPTPQQHVAPPAPQYHQPQQQPASPPPVPDHYIDPNTGFMVDSTGRRIQPPGSVPSAVVPAAGAAPANLDPKSRAAHIAREYAEYEPDIMTAHSNPLLAGSSMAQAEAAFVTGNNSMPDPKAVKAQVDPSPVVGINPRYRPHNR